MGDCSPTLTSDCTTKQLLTDKLKNMAKGSLYLSLYYYFLNANKIHYFAGHEQLKDLLKFFDDLFLFAFIKGKKFDIDEAYKTVCKMHS